MRCSRRFFREAGAAEVRVVRDARGDALDMRTNHLTHAWIEGREIDLDNRQRQLYRKFQTKYGAEILDGTPPLEPRTP